MEIPLVSQAQMIEVDRRMVDDYGIDMTRRMENAGRSVAELAVISLGSERAGRRVLVLAGSGGNGGGGLVAARHLANRGLAVSVVLGAAPERFAGLPGEQLAIVRAMGLAVLPHARIDALPPADLVIDALLGSSIEGPPRSVVASLIEWANGQSAPVISLDLPSGLHPDSGKPGLPTVRAEATLTLALPKRGLAEASAEPFVGALHLADISVPSELWRQLGVPLSGPLFEQGGLLRIR